jgi:hypothetical protein
MLALGVAPAIVRAGSLMPVRTVKDVITITDWEYALEMPPLPTVIEEIAAMLSRANEIMRDISFVEGEDLSYSVTIPRDDWRAMRRALQG